ncbi:hypothetical protein I79_026079 [Cricetulus griseus]|uniref:Uncharacterized protein n=1 Tax=Cricetulus griseus TaxID=10029 RepID=G3IPZ4_CRIGR|nr:hypothetical protein I79_026079 [Cricetulus griseus]
MKGVDGQKVLLSASQTGCEQRTRGTHPSFRAVLRCARSVGRKEELERRHQGHLPNPSVSHTVLDNSKQHGKASSRARSRGTV